MSRHNESRKMELRLRAEDEKKDSTAEKGERERAEMEQKASSRFSIHFLYWLREPRKHQGFIVNLKTPLTQEEIQSRMMKGFGDL